MFECVRTLWMLPNRSCMSVCPYIWSKDLSNRSDDFGETFRKGTKHISMKTDSPFLNIFWILVHVVYDAYLLDNHSKNFLDMN